MNIIRVSLTFFIASLSLIGCENKPALIWEEGLRPQSRSSQHLTVPIMMVADTQFHESRGTASRFFALSGDEFVPVTIRTAQQVIGAPDILKAVIESGDKFPLVLHLGDGVDVSCQTEWSLFNQVMGKIRGPPSSSSWLFTPGNHDGFFVGNVFPIKGGVYKPEYWSNMCNVGRGYINEKQKHDFSSKNTIVSDYINYLLDQPSDTKNFGNGSFCLDGKTLCVAYRISLLPWESYIVQLVKLPAEKQAEHKVYALMLDTSNYAARPHFWVGGPIAGIDAGLSIDQIRAAQGLLNNIDEASNFFFTGHHLFKDWKIDSWTEEKLGLLQTINSDSRSLKFIVTAHTHEGGWYRNKLGNGILSELNTGSLADAPLYFRTLSFDMEQDGAIKVISNRTLLKNGSLISCEQYPAVSGPGYSVNDQESENERLSDAPAIVRRTGSLFRAAGNFFAFWKAKHTELKPQLLAYAQIIKQVIPEGQLFKYQPFGTSYSLKFTGGNELAAHMTRLAVCNHKTKCSIQQKGNLLYSLDQFFWFSGASALQQKNAHARRYCAAIESAELAGRGSEVIIKALKESAPEQMVLEK